MNELPVEPEELVEPAVQFARPASQPRRGDVVGAVGENRLDQQRDVLGIVRSVGIEEHGDRRPDVRDGAANRLTLSATAVREHAAPRVAAASSGVPSVELPVDDDDLAGIAARPVDDVGDARPFLLCGDHRRHVGGDVMGRPRSSRWAWITASVKQVTFIATRPRCRRARVESARARSCAGSAQRPARTLPRMLWYASQAVQHCGHCPFQISRCSLRGLDGVPDRIQPHAGVAQPADRPRVGDAGIDHAPRVDEAARAQRMARHRRRAGQRGTRRGSRDTRSRAAAVGERGRPLSRRYSLQLRANRRRLRRASRPAPSLP